MRDRHIELYVDDAGEHRWRMRAGNSETTSGPGEGYQNTQDCLRQMTRDLAGVFVPDLVRDLPIERLGGSSTRHRLGVLHRMEPSRKGLEFVPAEIPVLEVSTTA